MHYWRICIYHFNSRCSNYRQAILKSLNPSSFQTHSRRSANGIRGRTPSALQLQLQLLHPKDLHAIAMCLTGFNICTIWWCAQIGESWIHSQIVYTYLRTCIQHSCMHFVRAQAENQIDSACKQLSVKRWECITPQIMHFAWKIVIFQAKYARAYEREHK